MHGQQNIKKKKKRIFVASTHPVDRVKNFQITLRSGWGSRYSAVRAEMSAVRAPCFLYRP